MSQFDMAAKRAERLLRNNWNSVVIEAHRIAGLGLPGVVFEIRTNVIRIYVEPCVVPASEGCEAFINRSGFTVVDVTYYRGGCCVVERRQGDIQDIARLLAVALKEAQSRASKMGDIASELAKIC